MGWLIGALMYAFALAFFIRPYWSLLRNQHGSRGHLQFTISDCWAASLGLSVTAWFVAAASQQTMFEGRPEDVIFRVLAVAIFFGASQLAGIAIVLTTEISPSRAYRNNSASAVMVILGALLGLLMPLLGPVLLAAQWRESNQAHASKAYWRLHMKRRANPRKRS